MWLTFSLFPSQGLVDLKGEGDIKVKSASEKAAATLPNTSPRGQDIIRSELKSLTEDFDNWATSVMETSALLGMLLILNSYGNLAYT